MKNVTRVLPESKMHGLRAWKGETNKETLCFGTKKKAIPGVS